MNVLPLPDNATEDQHLIVRPGAITRTSSIFLIVGWVVVLVGLGFITASAFMVDHTVVFWRLAPLFWAAPIWTILAAGRDRIHAMWSSAIGAVLVLVGAVIDLADKHPVAGRYELWLAGSAVLVTLAAWLAHATGSPDKA